MQICWQRRIYPGQVETSLVANSDTYSDVYQHALSWINKVYPLGFKRLHVYINTMELITQFSACDDKIIVRVASDLFLVNTVRDESQVRWNSVSYVKSLQWRSFDFTVAQVIICLSIAANALYVYVLHNTRDKGNADDERPLRRARLIASCTHPPPQKKTVSHKKQRKRNEWSDMKESSARAPSLLARTRPVAWRTKRAKMENIWGKWQMVNGPVLDVEFHSLMCLSQA